MNLAFNEHGEILSSGGALSTVMGETRAEMYRLNAFFGISRGEYIYEPFFGNLNQRHVGKIFTGSVISSFENDLTRALQRSDILIDRNYLVLTHKSGNSSLSIDIREEGTGLSYAWLYDTKTNRLRSVVEDKGLTASGAAYVPVSANYDGDGFLRLFNITDLHAKVLSENNLSIYDNIEITTTVYIESTAGEVARLVVPNEISIDMLNYTILFYTAPSAGSQITVELIPSIVSNLEEDDSPYFTRKYGE
jgi:hypothetical protein